VSNYKQSSPVSPTGPSRAERKLAARQHRVAVIGATRATVFSRDRACRACGQKGRLTDEMHEVKSRALLRGKPPEEIFNTANCVRVCKACHSKLTKHELWAIEGPLGCDGTVEFVRWARTVG
jgi:5-methylcytosine-specific restriction endonuclease McrA